MKTCPRCARTYPDAESFCEVDGTALTVAPAAVGTAKMVDAREEAIECPVCGGKAEPGELMCNFCGARLPVSGGAEPAGSPAPARTTGSGGERAGTARQRPENYIPARDKLTATEFTPPIPPDDEGAEEQRRPLMSIVGYSAAAIVALAGGAWLAIHLSAAPAISPPKAAEASPAPTASPAAIASGPTVDLAHSVQMQTFGESAAAPERSVDAARKVFESGKSALLDSYRGVLAGGSAIDDGMMMRLTVAPSGAVTGAEVRTSTSPNPALDAAAVKTMMGWTFAPINGGEVSADYPIIFARDAAQAGAIDSGLASKVAALGTTSSPEYAFAPAAVPTIAPPPALSPPPLSPPPMEATAPVVAPAPSPKRRRHVVASARPPKPSLLEQVQSALRSNRKLNQVNAYTNGGVVTLYGKVFDDNDKRLAVRTARSVGGVTDVIDQTTTDMAMWAARQQQISQALASAGLTGVTVKVIGRDAYLDGEVANKVDRDRAVTITQAAAPVTVRSNLIRVAVGRVFGF
ncbi:MAG TPA: TonB family protein [Candidatus Binataceae bacterium]|nr:TonB family protein [Candidatus Binataceae bacterium]